MRNTPVGVKKKLWYGVKGSVKIGPGFIHRAGLSGILIPHPPLVNLLLRIGLNQREHLKLGISHEFAHLQSMPFMVVYTIALFIVAWWYNDKLGWQWIVLLLLSSHAAWEMMAEAITVIKHKNEYSFIYRNVSPLPRILFWFLTSLLVFIGWYLILSNEIRR